MESALCTLLSALVVLLCSSPECKGEDTVTQPSGDTSVPQGLTETIHCTFETSYSGPTLFWYKQEGQGAPEHMMKKTKTLSNWLDTYKSPEFGENRFEIVAEQNSFSLKIQDVDVTDSAVYYCALTSGLDKLVFGSGTLLFVHVSEDEEPQFYRLEKGKDAVCLASGFSPHNKTYNIPLFNGTNGTYIDREDPDVKGLYSQVALLSPEDPQDICPESSQSLEDTLKPDPAVNLASLTVLGLRILFIKTIAFNVLFTLRLCISR